MPAALDGSLPIKELVSDYFLRDLHTRLFGPIWQWGGRLRRRELNIGVAPELIAVELRSTLGTIAWRWSHTSDWTARQLGIVVHAETDRIHPLQTGTAAQQDCLLTWSSPQPKTLPSSSTTGISNKPPYIAPLRAFDVHRDITDLAAFIGVERIEQPEK